MYYQIPHLYCIPLYSWSFPITQSLIFELTSEAVKHSAMFFTGCGDIQIQVNLNFILSTVFTNQYQTQNVLQKKWG